MDYKDNLISIGKAIDDYFNWLGRIDDKALTHTRFIKAQYCESIVSKMVTDLSDADDDYISKMGESIDLIYYSENLDIRYHDILERLKRKVKVDKCRVNKSGLILLNNLFKNGI